MAVVRLLPACMFVAWAAAVVSGAALQERESSGLTGLKRLSVVVEALPPAIAALGLNEQDVLNDLRRELADAKVEIATPGDATLYATLNAVAVETQSRRRTGVAYTIYLRVDQKGTLPAVQTPIEVTTWRHGGLGVASPGQARSAIRQQLAEYARTFVQAYRHANAEH